MHISLYQRIEAAGLLKLLERTVEACKQALGVGVRTRHHEPRRDDVIGPFERCEHSVCFREGIPDAVPADQFGEQEQIRPAEPQHPQGRIHVGRVRDRQVRLLKVALVPVTADRPDGP